MAAVDMQQARHELAVATHGKGLYDVSGEIEAWLSAQVARDGLLTVFIRHTSASLLIQENADPAVLDDLETFFARLVPEQGQGYRHATEGPDDMPAHIRAALTQTYLSIPVAQGRMMLGTWQGIYVYEHRSAPHTRRLVLHLCGT